MEKDDGKEMLEKRQQDYLYVLRKAVRGERLCRDRIADMELADVFFMAFPQTQAALFYQCFLDSGYPLPKELQSRCQKDLDQGIHRDALMNVERERIFDFMDKEKIWHCPLKGILLQELYPMLGLRFSSDNDILVDEKGRRRLKKFMKQRGYRVLNYGGSHHDAYVKEPSYHFEFHHRLLSRLLVGNAALRYFDRVEERLVPREGKPYLRELTREDFYLHLVVHMYVHYASTGTGLRGLVDLYYYLRSYPVDEAYVSARLAEFGMTDFETTVRSLGSKLFGEAASDAEGAFADEQFAEDAFTESELTMLNYLFASGVSGNHTIYAQNMLENCRKRSKTLRGAKLRYLWMRAFPNMEYYEMDYPFLYRHRVLIPFFLVYRLWKAMTTKRKLSTEFGVLMEASEKGSCGKKN